MAEIRGKEDLEAALLAALLANGGTIDLTFEQLGEGYMAAKSGEVDIIAERSAQGVRVRVGESFLKRIGLKGGR